MCMQFKKTQEAFQVDLTRINQHRETETEREREMSKYKLLLYANERSFRNERNGQFLVLETEPIHIRLAQIKTHFRPKTCLARGIVKKVEFTRGPGDGSFCPKAEYID